VHLAHCGSSRPPIPRARPVTPGAAILDCALVFLGSALKAEELLDSPHPFWCVGPDED
jgi:hypothetical protein